MPYYIRRKKTAAKSGSNKATRSTKGNKSTLVKKLDKYFALYIRLRDAMPSGYFRCISCGRIKPFEESDCGHFHSRIHMATRFDEENCNAECRYCLTPDALILMADLCWKPLGSVMVGDLLFGFNEDLKKTTSKLLKVSTVTSIEYDNQPVYDVELENGEHVKTTAEHKWVGRHGESSRLEWIATKDLLVNGLTMSGERRADSVTTEVSKIILGKLWKLNRCVKVKSVKPLGTQQIVVMGTSSHTFIANGYAMHNCNRFSADHLVGYQRNLIQKIGQKRFDLLNVKAHSAKHFMDFELEEMIEHYKTECKRLSSLKGIRVNI